jgi:3' terminal RNA ribose 2'-O-methyltransferase Hen1
MFLSISTTHRPATDLGFLLHKHPERVHETELGFGKAYVFYPEAVESRCEAVLVLDVDPVGLVRGRGSSDGLLDQYVNDRPYAASSFLSVALARSLRSAMSGTSKERPELSSTAIPLRATISPLPVHGGEKTVRALFEPLGWNVEIEPVEGVGSQAGGNSKYVTLHLTGEARLSALLNHIYVLVPVLDDSKHYWVGDDEVAKLLAHGEGWLEKHPAKELIVQRYLKHRRSLANAALERLAPETGNDELEPERRDAAEDALERPLRLNDERMDAVVEALRASGAKFIADLGCGEGKLLACLNRERWVERLIGVDAAARDLERAARKLKLHEAGGPPEGRVTLLHGSLTYRDRRLAGVDAAALVEVIEHLDPDRLPALQQVVFRQVRPACVIVTTPNSEFNVLFPNLARGSLRHPDHRFEWRRAEFRDWAATIESEYGYRAEFRDIGSLNDEFGAPTQMAIFTR